jgi:phytoene synthase
VRAAYARCRRMQVRYDPTFFLATSRLPREQRPTVHALYGFFRGADQIVDGDRSGTDAVGRRVALDRWHDALRDGLERGHSDHPVLAALTDAGRDGALPLHLLDVYMGSMRIDCDDRVRIADVAALDGYMEGSAATVGRIMAPVMGIADPDGREQLARLGVAFQLTNFVRDVAEDWAMNRIYLPGLDEQALIVGRATDALRGHVAIQVARARALFAQTTDVEQTVPASMRRGVRLARAVYVRILDRVERLEYDVLHGRTALRPHAYALAGVRALR